MKMLKIFVVSFATLIVCSTLAYGVYQLANVALASDAHAQQSCRGPHASHTVIIQNNAVSIGVQAARCDELTIINNDDTLRLIAFGPHDRHQAYDGVTEKALAKGQSLHIALDKSGTYTFHDHLHDEVAGSFTVE